MFKCMEYGIFIIVMFIFFFFMLQGGKGVIVMKVNVMERDVKMEVVKIFIVNFCVKGGDLFVVMV